MKVKRIVALIPDQARTALLVIRHQRVFDGPQAKAIDVNLLFRSSLLLIFTAVPPQIGRLELHATPTANIARNRMMASIVADAREYPSNGRNLAVLPSWGVSPLDR